MNENEIDRALQSDVTIEPSSDFASRVMVAARRNAREREAIAFPWGRLLPGLLACAAVTVAGLVLGPPPELPEAAMRIVEDPVTVQAVAWIPTSLVAIWALVWMSMRVVGLRR
jgi:hypothetical protein